MKYKHFKGGVYDFVCEAKLESNPQINMVVYRSHDGSTWTRRQFCIPVRPHPTKRHSRPPICLR